MVPGTLWDTLLEAILILVIKNDRKAWRLLDVPFFIIKKCVCVCVYFLNRCKSTALPPYPATCPHFSVFQLKVLIHIYTHPEAKIWINSTWNDELNIFQYLSGPSWLANIQIKIRMLMKTKCNLKSNILILWNCLWFFNCKMMLFY